MAMHDCNPLRLMGSTMDASCILHPHRLHHAECRPRRHDTCHFQPCPRHFWPSPFQNTLPSPPPSPTPCLNPLKSYGTTPAVSTPVVMFVIDSLKTAPCCGFFG